jgi:single-stranded-DNA-specific exonuclease
VLGLVAGRLTDEFGRPAFVFAQASAAYRGRGSARGVAGFNVMEALYACRDLLAQYGGHAQAAGFSIKRHKLAAFRERLEAWASQSAFALPQPGLPVLTIDAETSASDLSLELCSNLGELEPHGSGLALPLFLARHLRVLDYRVVGNNHLRLTLGTPRRPLSAIAFGWGDLAGTLGRDQFLDVVFHLEINEWNGERSVQLRVRDLAPSGTLGSESHTQPR